MTELSMEIESPDDTSAHRLERALGDAFALRIPVERVAEGSLPRFELKAQRWQK
jgi:phenylacetate-CoA ligase